MIRMIEERDIPTIWRWYNTYIEQGTETFEIETIPLEEMERRVQEIRRNYPWIVLEDAGEIVGYAYLSSFHEREAYRRTCDLSIYLNPEKKGKGYGSTLMQAIMDLAKEDGYFHMVSIITEGNEASMHLHEKFGFEKKGYFENFGYKFEKWLSVSYYVKKLTDLESLPHDLKNVDIRKEADE